MSEIRGVNVGNWLVLERWMDETPFAGTEAKDETALCIALGDEKYDRLKAHRDTYITEQDFHDIKKLGLNTVRIPIPHWIFDGITPYVECILYLDNAFDWAERAGLGVLLDLHTAPGCQNGFDNGGIQGVVDFYKKPEYKERAVNVIEELAKRYKNAKALYGIQLLNEPVKENPMDFLRDYYVKGYDACRRHLDENIAVVIHDRFNIREWKDFMQSPEYRNVILDTHMYQCFNEHERQQDMLGHLTQVMTKRVEAIKEMSEYFPLIIGEWSLGLSRNEYFDSLNAVQKDYVNRAYAAAQMIAYEGAYGWFFWSYKIKKPNVYQWDYAKCVNNGWISIL